MTKFPRCFAAAVLCAAFLSGCATSSPYVGVNPKNPQFERGMPCPPLDFMGDLLSKFPQLLFWNLKYGNHRISPETEKAIADFIAYYDLKDVKIRLNQWAPHKEIGRLIINPHIAWPYKIFIFPSTLVASLLGRPLSGLVFSDYYDPGSNTVNIFSDDPAIALHESGHAWDFSRQEYKGTYAMARMLPGVNLFQEGAATSEAMFYLEQTGQYEELLHSYKVLYPAYATYIISYIPSSPPAYVGAILLGHWVGRSAMNDKKWQLEIEGKWPAIEKLQHASDSPVEPSIKPNPAL